jgi:molybdopterin synthase catalytic subunit
MNQQTRDGLDPTAQVVLAEVREEDLSLDEVVAAVRHPAAGGIATFVGVVREHDQGAAVDALDYSAHPTAPDVLRQVAEEVAGHHAVIALAAVHRVGHLEIGDLAVVVAVSAAHRGAALEACRELIDTLKARVPIWKHQLFSDGSDEWVGLP